jgi:hypothetical protein
MAILKRDGVVDTTDPNNLKVEKKATPAKEVLTPIEEFNKKKEEAKDNKIAIEIKKDKKVKKKKKPKKEKMIMVKLEEEVEKIEKVAMFVPFAKVDKEKRMVFGIATSEAVDSVGDIVRIDAIEKALPDYMEFGNIREMHMPSAVGVVKEHKLNKKKKYLWIGVKVSDDQAWKKVLDGVYKGFSIGGNIIDAKPLKVKIPTSEISENEVEEKVLLQYAMGKKKCKKDEPYIEVATGGLEILELQLIEISLVDRPANPEALIDSFKSANKNKEFVPERVVILKENKDVDLTTKGQPVNFKVSFLNKSISENNIFNSLAKQLTMDKTLEQVMEAVFKFVKSQGLDLTDDNLSKAKSITLNPLQFKEVVKALIEKTYAITKDEGDDDNSDDEESEESVSEETEESETSEEEVDNEEGQSEDEESEDEESEEGEEEEEEKGEDTEKVIESAVQKALKPLVKQVKSVQEDVSKIKENGKAMSAQKGLTSEEAQKEKEENVFKGMFDL